MINIKRTQTIPASLNRPEIKQYIQKWPIYLSDPQNEQEPKKPGSYRNSDILKLFDSDFFAKCYLTEEQFVNSWSMDIDHFIPQNERPDLIYEWTNLFPISHCANMLKPKKTPEGGYLNPCDDQDDVETEIIYDLYDYGDKPAFTAKNPNNLKAINTAELLDRIHNGHNNDTNKATENLRQAIRKRYIEILNAIIEWQNTKENTQEQFHAKNKLKLLLSRKSSFCMLCRSVPAVRQNLPQDFFD
ncbi:MAG: hypothetical protein LBI18_14445 [Planctomycetaceae bacterium]|jgi:hypothetical protein|nr:hypothetical protein [Planctomycetaceae bacterium]